MRGSKKVWAVLVIGVMGLLLSSCAHGEPGVLARHTSDGADASPTMDTMHAVSFPEFVTNAEARVRQAYEYAVSSPDELAKYPCYCGCSRMGHTSALSCYVKPESQNGVIEFDNHASVCGVCLDITHDVIRLKAEGWSSLRVREYIDTTYSAVGPGTDTPLPKE